MAIVALGIAGGTSALVLRKEARDVVFVPLSTLTVERMPKDEFDQTFRTFPSYSARWVAALYVGHAQYRGAQASVLDELRPLTTVSDVAQVQAVDRYEKAHPTELPERVKRKRATR